MLFLNLKRKEIVSEQSTQLIVFQSVRQWRGKKQCVMVTTLCNTLECTRSERRGLKYTHTPVYFNVMNNISEAL